MRPEPADDGHGAFVAILLAVPFGAALWLAVYLMIVWLGPIVLERLV